MCAYVLNDDGLTINFRKISPGATTRPIFPGPPGKEATARLPPSGMPAQCGRCKCVEYNVRTLRESFAKLENNFYFCEKCHPLMQTIYNHYSDSVWFRDYKNEQVMWGHYVANLMLQ